MNDGYDDEQEKDQHRIAGLEIFHRFSARDLAGIFASLPKDARLVRANTVDYNNAHILYFHSARFKAIPRYGETGIIRATFSKQENGEVTVDDVEWPVEVEFPALKKADR